MDMAGCTRPRHPVVVSSADTTDMATMVVVYTAGTLHKATEAIWE